MPKLYPILAIIAGALLAAACSDGSGPGSPAQFSRQITFPDLQNALQGLPTNGAARAEIKLPASGLVAREVKLEDAQEVNEEEEVKSRITDLVLNAAGDQGTLTLEPGFQVTFTTATTFEDLTFQQFVDRVQAALGQNPKVFLPVEAKRVPANPLALGPGDAFPAAELELKEDVDQPKLEINVTKDNLLDVGQRDCSATLSSTLQGCLKVLGVTIGIDGTTELKAMLPGVVEAGFEGALDCKTLSVTDAHNGSFSLMGGPVIQVDQNTEIEAESGEEELADFNAVKAACDADRAVETEGEGVKVSDDPRTIRATEVEFKVEEQEEEGAVEFEGEVSAVDLDHRSVAVRGENGAVTVHVASDNVIDPESDLTTLQALAGAIGASPPQRVRAEGHGNPGSMGSLLEATDVKFEVEH
jgi:hypothetical protein